MPDHPEYRKRVRHFENPADCRELTFSCYGRRPLLIDDSWRAMLSTAIDRAAEGHGYRLVAFVYMPEHVHLIVYPIPGASGIDQFLKAIKRPFSYRIKQELMQRESSLLQDLTIRQRPGVTTFRYWQEGPGYDANLSDRRAALAAINYVHMNPVRRGLCETAVEWMWSSARQHIQPESDADGRLPTIHQLPPHFLND